MTDKTAIEKAKEDYQALVDYIENGMPLPPEDDPYWKASSALDSIGGFLADLEAEKPDEHDIEKLVEDICEPGSTLWSGETSDLDGEWIIYPDNEAIGEAIKSYAESYHASRCKEESAAILAASDRLGAALDESDKGR